MMTQVDNPRLTCNSVQIKHYPGTENVSLVVGFGRAAELAMLESSELYGHMEKLRDDLQEKLLQGLPQVCILV
jgi:cysteine sulfinate desulfinase/cysteine desulfurase-like protein